MKYAWQEYRTRHGSGAVAPARPPFVRRGSDPGSGREAAVRRYADHVADEEYGRTGHQDDPRDPARDKGGYGADQDDDGYDHDPGEDTVKGQTTSRQPTRPRDRREQREQKPRQPGKQGEQRLRPGPHG